MLLTENNMILGLRQLIRSDLRRCLNLTASLSNATKPKLKDSIYCILFKAGFQAVLLYRVSHWFYKKNWIFMARLFMRLNLTLTGADIGFAAEIGPGLMLGHPVGVVIAHKTVIGKNVTLLQGVLFGVHNWKPDAMEKLPRVGDYSVLCTRCMILGDVEIGAYCVIGANAMVSQNVEDGAFAVGNPLVIAKGKGKHKITEWCL